MALIDDILAKKPPVLLYHYTSQAGLLGAIKSKSLWASNIHYMNDSREFLLAIDITQKVIHKRLKSSTADPIRKFLVQLEQRLTMTSKIYIYAFCFSEEGDLLSQWRAYCPAGSGFSWGIEYTDPLRSLVESQGFRLVSCVYKQTEQEQLMSELVDATCSEYNDDLRRISSGGAKVSPSLARQHIERFIVRFVEQAPIIKHHGFSEEREWRLISGPIKATDDRTKVREGKSNLVPYFELKIAEHTDKLQIGEVIIGPTPHEELALGAVTFLETSGRIACSKGIKLSRIPYQSW